MIKLRSTADSLYQRLTWTIIDVPIYNSESFPKEINIELNVILPFINVIYKNE